MSMHWVSTTAFTSATLPSWRTGSPIEWLPPSTESLRTNSTPTLVVQPVPSRPANPRRVRVARHASPQNDGAPSARRHRPRKTASQGAPIDEIVNSLTPVVDTVPPSTQPASPPPRSRRRTPSSATPLSPDYPPSVPSTASNLSAPQKPSEDSRQEVQLAALYSDVVTDQRTEADQAFTEEEEEEKQKEPAIEDDQPIPPLANTISMAPQTVGNAVPKVTPEETAFLNEQLEKRKTEKKAKEAARATKNAATPRKRSRGRAAAGKSSTSSTAAAVAVAKVAPASKKALERPSSSSQAKKKNLSTHSKRQQATGMRDTFRAYMSEISNGDLLGQSEILALAKQIRDGMSVERAQLDMQTQLGRRPSVPELAQRLGIQSADVQQRRMAGTAAKNALVSANLRLVTSVATKLVKGKKRPVMQGLTLEDMVQEGSVGLLRAAEKFDASRGYKFSTYATWWVRAYVLRSITNQGRSIKVPSSVVDEYARIRKMYTELQESSGTKPSEDAVANRLGITPAKLRFVVTVVTQAPASLDVTIDYAGDSSNPRTLGDIITGDDHIEERMVEDMERRELDIAMRKHLRPLERAVIRLRFGLEDGQPRSFREIGELLNLSKERIRQIVFRALPKLKTPEIQRMLVDATAR